MDEFNLDDNIEFGTSISKLKNNKRMKSNNNDIFNLIKDLEIRLNNIETKNNIETNNNLDTNDYLQTNLESKEKEKIKEKNNMFFKYKNIIIYIIFFIILNNQYVIEFIYNFPYIKTLNSPYPNLIIRTLIFGLLIYLFRTFRILNTDL